MNVLLWFTVDLRVQRNAVVNAASSLGPVIPVYIVDPEQWAQNDRYARQWEFVAETLHDLRDDLAAIGAPLAVRTGATLDVLARLWRRHDCSHLVYGEPPPHVNTDALSRWAAAEHVMLHPIPATNPPVDFSPQLTSVSGVEPGPIPTAKILRLAPDPCPHRQPGGRRRAEAVLGTHLARPPSAMSPLFVAAERSASRLSPYLAHGVLSDAEVHAAIHQARADVPGPSTSRIGATVLRGLGRRADLSGIDVAGRRESDDAPSARMAAWRTGQTGLPFIDACLRYLEATGWLPDRARALVLSVACHHLDLDWRRAADHLAALSTDYDPAVFWPLARRVAVGDGTAVPRIADPMATGCAMDPTGALIRTWVPELKPLPDAVLHRPWRWDGARGFLGSRYPEPLVDPATATRNARAGASAKQLELGLRCHR